MPRYTVKSKSSLVSRRPDAPDDEYSFKLFGCPVEEVDPFVFEDTFCVIAQKFRKPHVYRFSATKSLFIFPPLNPIRKLSIRILTNPFFDLLLIVIIIANCVLLGLYTNIEIGTTERMEYHERKEYVIDLMEYIFLGIFTLEMLVKVIAKGFVISKFSYLRNQWNILDFVILCAGYISIVSLVVGENNMDFLASLRVFRAIKAVSIIPGLRMMINALLKSAKQLVEVLILTLFCLMIFSLIALQLFMGRMSQKCVLVKNGVRHLQMVYEEFSRDPSELDGGPIDPNDPDNSLYWYQWVNNEKNWLLRMDDYPKQEYQPCANSTWISGRKCPEGYMCLRDIGENYDDGWTSFDNFFRSMLTTFQLLTTDFWERPYELIISSTSPLSVIFCIIVIFMGFFYLLNLLLAVVAMSYEEEYQQSTNVSLTNHQRLSLNRKASTFSFEDPRKLNVSEMTAFRRRTPSEREMLARTLHGDTPSVYESEFDFDKKTTTFSESTMKMIGRSLPTPVENQTASAAKNLNAGETKGKQSTTRLVKTEKGSKNGLQPLLQIASDSMVGRMRPSALSVSWTSSTKTIATAADKSISYCSRCLYFVRAKLQPIVNHNAFDVIIRSLIIGNTVLLAVEHHHEPPWLQNIEDIGNYFFTAAFILEALIKICALQKHYFLNWWNLFDLILVIFSILELSLKFLELVILRSIRLLRVFKLANSWITMKVLMRIIFSTFGALGNLTMIILIVIYIFAVLCLQSIGKYYTRRAFESEDDLEKFPRWHFRDFRYAFMMVFRVLCGEWIEPLWDCLYATSRQKDEWKCFFLFVPIFVVGNLITINLFLALLLNSFDSEQLESKRLEELEAARKQEEELEMVLERMKPSTTPSQSQAAILQSSSSELEKSGRRTTISTVQSRGKRRFRKAVKKVISINSERSREESLKELKRKETLRKRLSQLSSKKSETPKKSIKLQLNAFIHAMLKGITRQNSSSSSKSDIETRWSFKQIHDPYLCLPKKCWQMNCCFFRCCRRWNCRYWDLLRSWAILLVTHPVFEWFILALIFASSITLCFEDVYLESKPALKETLFYINTTFTFIFVTEMLLKWLGLGLWVYFTSWWTILDGVIVIVSLMSWTDDVQARQSGQTKQGRIRAFRALRTLRALRPLRAISRWQGMKIVVNAVMFAIPSIVNVLLVCLLFWLIFSIMGVHFFKGEFYSCVDNESGGRVEKNVAKTKEECCNATNNHKYSWINQTPNFDNVVMAYLTLFQVATFEGWMEAIQASVDSVKVDEQPERDHSMWPYVFWVIFIVFGSFFTLNLFIGVIIDNFNKLKKKYEGNVVEMLLTPSQRHYYTAMKKLGRKKPQRVIQRPTNAFLAMFYDISLSKRFDTALLILICLNMVIMAFRAHNQNQLNTDILDAFNSLFTCIYVIEAVIKIVGLRKYYFTVPWNIFDFALVSSSIIDITAGELLGVAFRLPPNTLRLVRVFRIGRALRLIKAAKGIRKLLFALVVSLPAIINIGALLSLITFIYAIMGMALFSGIAKNKAIDEVFNFDTFGSSCLVLFRLMMMAAGWNDVLAAMTVETPDCGGTYRNIRCGNVEAGEGLCPNFALAAIYIVSFLFITDLIVINMYVAIILENFYDATREEEVGIIEDDLDMFYVRWSRFDPLATQFIDFDQLSDFLASLDPPLYVPKPNTVAIVAFDLPIAKDNRIHCLDIIHALIRHVLGQVDESYEFRQLQEDMNHKFRKKFPTRKLLEIISSTRYWRIQFNAAVRIQKAWRAHRARVDPRNSDGVKGLAGSYLHTSIKTHIKDHQGMLNKMGHVLSVGYEHSLGQRLKPTKDK